MKKFEIIKNHTEVAWEDRLSIKAGITLQPDNQWPKTLASFDTLEEAKEELKKYKSDIRKMQSYAGLTYYDVTEYYVEENDYDEDDDWISGGDVWAFTEMNFDEEL